MPDITFDDLINAKNTAQTKPEGDGFLSGMSQEGLMQLGTTALSILKEFKGIQGGVIDSRGAGSQTPSYTGTTEQLEVEKPMVDVDQIKEALETVKGLKGDITITAMLKLLEENKAAVAGFLKGV